MSGGMEQANGQESRSENPRVKRRPMLTALWMLVAVYVGLALLAAGCQRSLMYFPDRRVSAPRDAGLAGAEVMRFETEDGFSLTGWFIPLPGARRAVVVFHGNAGNISHRAHLVSVFHAIGCSVMLAEYRGYGGNPGSPSEKGLYADARAAVAALAARPDVDAEEIIYYGESLGSGPATQMALERPPRALILDSAFTSMPDVAASHYWYLPVRLVLLDRYENLSKIGRLKCPVMIIYPEKDTLVPPDHGRALFAAAPEPKAVYEVPGVNHNETVMASPSRYVEEMRRFLARIDGKPHQGAQP